MARPRLGLSIRSALLAAGLAGLLAPSALIALLRHWPAADLLVGRLPSGAGGADAAPFAWGLLVAQLLCTGSAVGLVWWLRLKRPLAQLHDAAHALGQRGPAKVGAPPEWARNDELGRLGRQLAESRRQIDQLFATLERKNAQLRRMAMYDDLTSLPNRALFRELFVHEAALARRSSRTMAMLFIDLDRFKAINDTMGHAAGDEVLRTTSQRLQQVLRESDVLCRHSGDEFLVLLRDAAGWPTVASAAERLLAAAEAPVPITRRPVRGGSGAPLASEVQLSASIGIAMFPEDGEDYETLVRQADVAMYQSKEQGRARFCFYQPEFNLRRMTRIGLERELAHAISHDQLVLHYQPVVDAATGRLTGCEALVRWQHPLRGLLLPRAFIGVAEESGLVRSLGQWTLDAACTQMAAWRARGLLPGRVSINVSAQQFRDDRLIETLDRNLLRHGVRPEELEIELTESTLMGDDDVTQRVVGGLRERGIALSVDDFGTGYSSLSYLKRLRPAKLKIDRSFVQDLPDDPDDGAVTQAILSMAHALDIAVVAEGVETMQQQHYLTERGCTLLQGYLTGLPMSAGEFEERIRERDLGLVSVPLLVDAPHLAAAGAARVH